VVVPPPTVAESVTVPVPQREGLFGLLRLGNAGTMPSGLPVKSVMDVIHVPAPNVFTPSPSFILFTVNGGVPFNV
jgi:hypothetical protein